MPVLGTRWVSPAAVTAGMNPGTITRRRPPALAQVAAVMVAIVALMGMHVLLGGPRASAHASLLGSVPEHGARLEQPLERLELTFSEPVEPEFSIVRLKREDGTELELGPLRREGETLVADIPGQLEAGDYVVHYQVLSVDGHTVEGEVPFTVVAAGPEPSGGGSADEQVSDEQAEEPAGSEPSVPSEPEAAEDQSQGTGRGRSIALVIGVVVVAAAIGGGALWWLRSRARGR